MVKMVETVEMVDHVGVASLRLKPSESSTLM